MSDSENENLLFKARGYAKILKDGNPKNGIPNGANP
jgi:hypothetical protein